MYFVLYNLCSLYFLLSIYYCKYVYLMLLTPVLGSKPMYKKCYLLILFILIDPIVLLSYVVMCHIAIFVFLTAHKLCHMYCSLVFLLYRLGWSPITSCLQCYERERLMVIVIFFTFVYYFYTLYWYFCSCKCIFTDIYFSIRLLLYIYNDHH